MAETKATQSEIQPGTWITPTLSTGWTVFDSGPIPSTDVPDTWRFPRYYKDAMGFIHLDGLTKNNSGGVNSGSTNPIIFILPAGFRPGHTLLMTTTANDAWGRVDIRVNGEVRLNSTNVANGAWLSLNGITFLAEQ